MDDFDWLKKVNNKKKDQKDEHGTMGFKEGTENEHATEFQEGKEDQEATEVLEIINEIKKEKEKDEITTIVIPQGEPFDPFKNFSVLALVDIAPELKKIRPDLIPSFFHIKRPVTLIGTGKRAHIKVDDLKTIKPEHGAIVFRQGSFLVFSQEDTVKLEGALVPKDGSALANGSLIEMGSARFIFLTAEA